MVRYDDYKDSGINWIGEIPSGWELRRIKSLVSNIDETIPDNPPITIPLERVMPWTGEIAISDSIDDEDGCSKGFKGGDILFSKLRPYLAKAVLAPCDGACSGEMLVLRADNIERSYLHKIVLSPGFIDTINAMTYGAKMPRASWDLFKDIVVPLPSRLEQEKIASWLNKTTGEIDATVHNIEASICLLHEYRQSIITEAVTHGLDPNAPLKPSGIDWIGDIPTAWSIIPLKYMIHSIKSGTSVNGATWPANEQELGVLSLSSVFKGVFRPRENKQVEGTEAERLTCPLEKGSLLISRCNTSEWVGTAAYVDTSYDNLYCPDKIWQLSFASSTQAKSIKYYLDSKPSRIYFESMSVGASSSMQNISKEDLLNIPIVIPENPAQIIDYLDAKTAEIDALIASKERQVELLREYRKSIIAEAVTGKFKVPGLE